MLFIISRPLEICIDGNTSIIISFNIILSRALSILKYTKNGKGFLSISTIIIVIFTLPATVKPRRANIGVDNAKRLVKINRQAAVIPKNVQ